MTEASGSGSGSGVRIFVGGPLSGAGKSTVSLGLLGALLNEFKAEEL